MNVQTNKQGLCKQPEFYTVNISITIILVISEGPHKTCYNCGYMQVDGGDAQPLPDENQEYFCGDTVAPDVSLFMSIPFLGVFAQSAL